MMTLVNALTSEHVWFSAYSEHKEEVGRGETQATRLGLRPSRYRPENTTNVKGRYLGLVCRPR